MKYKFLLIKASIAVLAFVAAFSGSPNAQTVPQEVWIAVRTDGQPGSGTIIDPYDGSTQAKFDALLNAIPPNVTINLGPGTFRTHTFATDAGWQQGNVKSGWTVQGAGMYDTTIQAVGSAAGIHYNVHVLQTPYNVSRDNIVLRDFTVDCNWAELGPTADDGETVRQVTAVTTNGSPTVTVSAGGFTEADIGNVVKGTGIPSNSFIGVINSSTSVGLSSSAVNNVPVNATASGSNVTLDIVKKHIAIDAVLLYGSNNLIDRCRHINTYGEASITYSNEEFGFTLSGPLTMDGTGNVIRFCRGESPAGHYGSAFNIFGYSSQNKYAINSQIHDCVAVGKKVTLPNNAGVYGVQGFSNGIGGFGYAKSSQFYNNTGVDVNGIFYTDTGSLDTILIANNTLVRGNSIGIAMVQDADPTWTKTNIEIVGNHINLFNADGARPIWISGATASNISISGNYLSFTPADTVHSDGVHPIDCAQLDGATISGNVADEDSASPASAYSEALGLNVTLCLNRTTSCKPLTGLPDNCLTGNAPGVIAPPPIPCTSP